MQQNRILGMVCTLELIHYKKCFDNCAKIFLLNSSFKFQVNTRRIQFVGPVLSHFFSKSRFRCESGPTFVWGELIFVGDKITAEPIRNSLNCTEYFLEFFIFCRERSLEFRLPLVDPRLEFVMKRNPAVLRCLNELFFAFLTDPQRTQTQFPATSSNKKMFLLTETFSKVPYSRNIDLSGFPVFQNRSFNTHFPDTHSSDITIL